MSYTLVLNSKNVIGANNNIFQYRFLNGFKISDNAEICISAAQVPYSWYNVSYFYQNTDFNIIFPRGAGLTTTVNISLPDGFYTVDDINSYIRQKCIENNWYLINSSGNYVYYIDLSYNISAYKIELLTFLVPTSLPVGWVDPGWGGGTAGSGLPTVTRCTQFVVLDNNFKILIGFNPGTYPTATPVPPNSFSKLSDFTPLGSNVNSIIMRCNLVSNPVTMPSDIVDSFAISNASFGSNINYNASFEKWVRLSPGVFQNLTITLQDEQFNDIKMLDPNSVITINIRNK
jgi:hypothetical protein